MKRNKLGLSTLLFGAVGFLACVTSGETGSVPSELLNQNSEILVVLPGTTRSRSEKEIKDSQNNFLAKLNTFIGRDNYTLTETYDAINVVKIKTNEAYLPLIQSISGVQSAQINQAYRFSEVSSGKQTEAEKEEGYVTFETAPIDATDSDTLDHENQSANTMNVPMDNAGGAGSFVAILDSGFYLEHSYYSTFDDEKVISMARERFNYEDLENVYDDLTATHNKTLDHTLADDPTYEGGRTSTNDVARDRADGSLYWSLKIPFYYDYGASSKNSANDYDVLSTWSNHGNHVASITGANGAYDGIAPNAQLALMKVFYESIPSDTTSAGGVYAIDDDILEALNDCVVLGVDALNMSLGSDLDDFTNKSTSMDVLDKLSNDGVNCNIAAGNAGKDLFSSMSVYKDWSTDLVDTGVLGSYSNSTTANVVASSTNPTQYYETGIRIDQGGGNYAVFAYDDQVDYTEGNQYGITPETEHVLADITEETGSNSIKLITAGNSDSTGNFYGTSADYQKVTAELGPDYFRDKVAVVDRGSNSFLDKAQAAEDAGCAGLIVINNDPTAYEFNFGMSWATGDASGSYSVPEIPVVFVLYADRETILDSLDAVVSKSDGSTLCYESSGESTTLIADREDVNPKAWQLSDFSSEGATSTLDLNPNISAPGTSIRGAVLGEANAQGQVPEDSLDPNSVGYLSGTSMATPNYTGISALLLGEKQAEAFETGHLLTDEERLKYLKTITMRTMSTADQYTLEDYVMYDNFTSEDTVTDDEYETPVTIYKAEGTTTEVQYSPRKQGAGVVNAGDAINSDVYLEGLIPDEETGNYAADLNTAEGNNFAKIELRNNEKVANGNLSLGFRLHNEGDAAKTYKAKLKVFAPLINKYHNHDNELPNYVANDTTFEGAELQTSYDKLLEEVDLNVTVTVDANSTTSKTVDYQISNESKEYLAKFKNGAFLEGYLIFEDTSADGIDLSMPYMGFYEDYGQAEATEPFEFEKEERYDMTTGNTDGFVYGSDLINYLGANSYSRSYINTSSMIVGASYDDYQAYNRKSGVLTNSTSPADFGNELTYTKDGDDITLYVGSDETDVLYIQEFVYRSLSSEVVEIKDETGDTVVTGNVKDIITNQNELYKSHVSSSYISDYSLAHRGYAELPLYYANGARLQDGNYTINFTYNLVYGSTQTKEFNLVIDSKAPAIVSKSIITDSNGNKTLRLKFNEIYIPSSSYVHINADTVTDFTLTKVSDGYYLDIKIPETLEGDKLYINISDGTYNYSYYLVNSSDLETGLMIESDALTPGSTFSYTKTTEGSSNNISDRYVIEAKDYTGGDLNLGEYTVILSYPKRINSAARVYGVTSSGSKVSINYTRIDDTTITFTTTYTTFTVEDNGRTNDYITDSGNASVSFTQDVEGGTVYVDKVSGFSGEISTIYAIPDAGYRVSSVKVNGVEIARDLNGNYQFVLSGGVNVVEVTFVAA